MTQRRYNPFHQAHLFQHMRNPVAGNIYYVEGTDGNDANDGRTLETAFETITHALTVVDSDNNDYVYVRRIDNDAEEYPLIVDEHFVHLIGMPYGASPRPQMIPPGDTDGFDIQAGGVEIAGFDFGTVAANNDACITVTTGTQWRIHIHHNNFAWQTEAYDCIRLDGATNVYIHHNNFGAHGYTNVGVYIFDAVRARIEDNLFFVQNSTPVADANFGVHVDNTLQQSTILNNVFVVPDAADGEAITLDSYGGCMIDGNRAMSGNIVMTFNPYRDLNVAAANEHAWGVNYAGPAPTYPVTV